MLLGGAFARITNPMKSDMHFSLRLTKDPDGTFCAQCPELGLTANAFSREEASDRLTSLIMDWLSFRQAVDQDREPPNFISGGGSEFGVFPLIEDDKIRLLYVPKDISQN